MQQTLPKYQAIAEKVQDAGTLRQLREFKCHEAQGHHFAQPMSAAEFRLVLLSAKTA